MGDVFDAMNRAKREKGQAKPGAADSSAAGGGTAGSGGASGGASGGDEKPALPMDQIQGDARRALDEDTRQLTPSSKLTDVTAAPRLSVGASASDAGDVDLNASTASTTAAPLRRDVFAAAAERAKTGSDATAGGTDAVVPGSPRYDPSLNGYASQIIVHHDRGSVITEQYRSIRTQILARGRNRRLQVHVITSSAPEEGKSVTTVNMGMTFAELRNQRVLLVEGDLRRPTFQTLFDRSPTPGLIHLLRGEATDIQQAIHPTVYPNLQFMPAGDRDFVSSTELLSSPRMHQLLDRLRDRYDHIFIDTPPVVTVTDACILGAMADETILVVRINKTPAEMVERAKRLLRAANCDVAGAILTHMPVQASRYAYRYA